MQDNQAQGQGLRDLRESQAQAKTRLMASAVTLAQDGQVRRANLVSHDHSNDTSCVGELKHVNVLSKTELKTLAEARDKWCVSIFMPTHRAGVETRQDPIRLKNVLGETEKRLLAKSLRTPDVEALLAPAYKLLQDGLFWRGQSDGLAIFISPQMSRHYRLPLDFEGLVAIEQHFHLKPLLPLLSGDGRFYVLAISQNAVRLLQGTRHSVSQVELMGIPSSLDEALKYDDPESRLQFHTATGALGGHGERAAVFHGHGVGSNDAKTNILRYFHRVDESLTAALRDEQSPLVLIAVDYLHPLYGEANTYPHLVGEGVEGNPEELSAKELHRRAWDIVEPRFLRAQTEAAERYRQLAETEQASSDLKKVVPAAHYGRVETLFVAVGLQQWGTFDLAINAVQVHPEAEPGDEDLLNCAAIQTLLNGGTVYAVEPEKVPGEALLAAVFRY